MVRQFFQSISLRPDDPAARDYVSLVVLLVATALFQRLATAAVWLVSESIPDPLDPRLVGAVVYATLAFAALVIVFTLFRRRRPARDPLDAFEWRFVGAITFGLLLLGAYLLHGATALPAFPDATVRTLLAGPVALGVPAVLYARAHGFDVDLSLPDRDARWVAVVTGLVAALGGVTVWIVSVLATGTGPLNPNLVDPASTFSAGTWLASVVFPVLFGGLGWGLLYNGAVQPLLRERLGPDGAVAGVTTFLSLVWWSSPGTARMDGPLAVTVALVGGVLLPLLVALLVAWGIGSARRSSDRERRPAVAALVGVLPVSLVVAVTFATGTFQTALLSWGLGYAIAAAAACVGAARSRSLWVPIAAYTMFGLLTDLHVARLLTPLLP